MQLSDAATAVTWMFRTRAGIPHLVLQDITEAQDRYLLKFPCTNLGSTMIHQGLPILLTGRPNSTSATAGVKGYRTQGEAGDKVQPTCYCCWRALHEGYCVEQNSGRWRASIRFSPAYKLHTLMQLLLAHGCVTVLHILPGLRQHYQSTSSYVTSH